MSKHSPFKVEVVQASPMILDLQAVDKAIALIDEAGANGSNCVETFSTPIQTMTMAAEGVETQLK
jgi:hypothetical protein